MLWPYIVLALVIGAALPLQIGGNAELARHAGSAVWAATASFVLGSVALLAAYGLARQPWPSTMALAGAPWWAWAGAALGAVYVLGTIVAAPKLGAAALVALVVTGQMVASLAIDHFGAVGFPVQAINPWRLLGVVFLLLGVVLIQRF